MNLSQMRHSSAPENAVRFTECLDLIATAASEIRNLSYLLHPPLMDELGLGSALTEYVKGFESRSGLEITVQVSNDIGRLKGNREIALYRIVQESLANVRRHSGSSAATIRLFRDKQNVVLEIADQGHGMEGRVEGRFRAGVGLRSMQERVRPFGGSLAIESSAAGTKVKVILPESAAVMPMPD